MENEVIKKVCTHCREEKTLDEFYKLKKNGNIFRSVCKTCVRNYYENTKNKNYKRINKLIERYLEFKNKIKKCLKCGEQKKFEEFHKKKDGIFGISFHCKECNIKYYYNNVKKISVRHKKYRDKNKKEITKRRKINYYKNKEKNSEKEKIKKKFDPVYKLKIDIRSIIGKAIRKEGYTKKSRTFEILGCSYEDFKIHIESLFLPGMSWENRSLWHLDHRVPVSWAKNEKELIKLNHYTNFKPMWAIDNQRKNNRWADL